MKDLTVWGYQGAAAVARRIPTGWVPKLPIPLGTAAATIGRQRRAMVERHLERVDPTMPPDALRDGARRAFASYAEYWIESFRLPYLDRATVEDGIVTEGYDPYVLDGLAAGNGVILALPHLGGWEWAGRWLTGRGHRVSVVVEALEPPELFEWFVDLREDLGMNVIPLGPAAARQVLAALDDNHVVCLLCDRDLGGHGIEVDFFGERTRLPAGPAVLSLRSGAPLLPTAVYFAPGDSQHLGIVRPPLTLGDGDAAAGFRRRVGALTQLLADELELLIRRDPEQWHLFQPNWPSDPGYGESDDGR